MVVGFLQAGSPPSDATLWWSYLRVLLVLAGMLGLAWLALQAAKRNLLPGVLKRRARNLEVIERLPLDPRRSVYLVRAGSKILTVGISESGIRLLTELSPGDILRDASVGEAPT